MNIEIEVNGNKVSVEAPHVNTTEEAESVAALAVKALHAAMEGQSATPRPFGFSLSSDTERDTSGEVAEDAEAVG